LPQQVELFHPGEKLFVKVQKQTLMVKSKKEKLVVA